MAGSFGFLTGFAYTIPFALCGLYFGKLTKSVNRKITLGLIVIAAGATMGISGSVNSFTAFAAMRVVLGIISSACNPLSFSLISDYFPAERRTTANSIIQGGNFIGWGLSSISILAISKFGWRAAYCLLGGFASMVGVATILFIKEPVRGGGLIEQA